MQATYHNVPSTSNMMPFSFGALCLFAISGLSGAKRRGFLDLGDADAIDLENCRSEQFKTQTILAEKTVIEGRL